MPAGELSQHTLELIDEEVKRIISECAEEAKRQLAKHRDQPDHLAQALLERETLDEADAYAVGGIPQPTAVAQPVAARAQSIDRTPRERTGHATPRRANARRRTRQAQGRL
jgi:Peptidase family M41